MTLPLVATVIGWLAVLIGLTLATCHIRRWQPPRVLAWAHPPAAIAALACAWVAVALWPGRADLLFNSGAFVLTLGFVAGAFLFSLRLIPARLPIIAIGMHGIAGIGGCVLLTVGLLRVLGHA